MSVSFKNGLPKVSKPIESWKGLSSLNRSEFFTWLISPLSLDEFSNEIWEQKPYVISRKNREYCKKLFNGGDFDVLLEFSRFSPTEIRVVVNGKQRLFTEYTKADGRVDIGAVSLFYLEKHSIIIHSLENFNSSIAEFTQSLRQFFSARVLINAYLTPRGSQALEAHFDSHDVFIVQIEGSKNWRLYNSATNCPLDGTIQPNFSRDELPEPRKITLEKGDVMYIPRGWVHDAEASEESSLHLTIGIHPTQWVDFMSKAMVALSLTHQPFRRSLPLGFLRNQLALDDLQNGLIQLADVLKKEGSAKHAFSILQHEFIQNENSIPSGSLIATLDNISKINLDSVAVKRPHIYSRIISAAESVSIQFNNATLQAPPSYIDALEYISNCTTDFVVSDLPNLPDNSKISLIQRLVRDGLLLCNSP